MTTDSQQSLVGISISESPDLERLGLGKEHLAELMMSIARAVLRIDDRIGLVYGGDLRPEGFTWRLFDIALSEHSQTPEPPRRIYNYMAWPYYLTLARYDEARMINACHFMRVGPKDADFSDIPDNRDQRQQLNPPEALIASRCLTRMRELATYGGHPTLESEPAPPIRARILLGGKSSGYSSFMPGLFEEFLISRSPPNNGKPIPVFVIGALGGAAGQLAGALLGKDKEDPLTLKFQREQETAAGRQGLEQLIGHYDDHLQAIDLEGRYQALGDAIRSLRDAITGSDAQVLDNGLTPSENRTLLTSRDESEIRRLVVKGITALAQSAQRTLP